MSDQADYQYQQDGADRGGGNRLQRGLRDRELLDVATSSNAETTRQLAGLNTRMNASAPQASIVAP